MIGWTYILYSAIVVVGLIEFIKDLDEKGRLKKFYPWLAIFLSIVCSVVLDRFLADELGFWSIVLHALIIFATSTLTYDTVVDNLKLRMKNKL